jgi:hypothetical protein
VSLIQQIVLQAVSLIRQMVLNSGVPHCC